MLVTCLPAAAKEQQAAPSGGGGERGAKPTWQLLQLRVGPGYPAEAPTAVFPRTGRGPGASAAAAATAACEQQLLDACRDEFAARMAAAPPPARVLDLAQAWLGATQHVAALAAARQQQLE